MTTVRPARVEIDNSVYDPYDLEQARDPWAVYARLRDEFPVAYHRDLKIWVVSGHELALEVYRDPRLSTSLDDWNEAPAPKPVSEWNLRDRVQAAGLDRVGPEQHHRLRKLTIPAFSRRVMNQIEARIRDVIAATIDEFATSPEFDVAPIAEKIPPRTIARMLGLPADKQDLFENGLAANSVRASNPMYAADRDKYVAALLPGLQYLLDTIVERRAQAEPGDDFIGTLISTVIDGERLDDMEILSLINALVVAGADTAVDLHTYAVHAFDQFRDQWQLLRQKPELAEAAVVEVLRWAAHGKFGAIPRFPLEDVEYGGQRIAKGEFVWPLMGPSLSDPRKWDDPRRLDITRSLSGNIVFGAGPHMCIGLNMVKVQGKLLLEEWARRFGDDWRVVDGPEIEHMHFNARRIKRLVVRTGE